MALIHHGVEDSGYAMPVAQRLAMPDARRVILVRKRRHFAAHPVDCVFVDEALRSAVRLPHEAAFFGIRRRSGYSEDLAGLGVDGRAVPIRCIDEDGPVGRDRIENLAIEVAFAKNAGIPAYPLDPASITPARGVSQAFLQFFNGCSTFEIDEKRPVGSAVLQVNVGVLESGQHQPALSIDNSRRMRCQRPDVLIAA